MYNRDNLKLRLNLVKRAVITYELGDDTSVVIDISGDGKIRINDNGIVKDTDTVAAVAGGMAGIIYGLEDVHDWVEKLRNKEEIIECLW